MLELSRRVEVVILSCSDGTEEVTERHENGLIAVRTTGSLEAARVWVEAHYEGVEWHKTRLASGLIGRFPATGVRA